MAAKACYKCKRTLELRHFSRNVSKPDGLDNRCRDCRAEEDYRRREPEEDEPERKRAKTGDLWLYVLSLDSDPCGLTHGFKIGRTQDVDTRIRALGICMPFRFIEHARFRCSGHLEALLHAKFADRRNDAGAGREWFRVSLSQILEAISQQTSG